MSKHTPGPWMADEAHYSDAVVVVDSRGFQIVEATHMPILLGYGEKLGISHWADKPGEAYLELEPEEQAANARLIAAAPELLEALKLAEGIAQRVIAMTGFDERHIADWRPRVRAAISNATGANP